MKRHALAGATEFARREKRPRSDVVREALVQYLDATRWQALQRYGARMAKP